MNARTESYQRYGLHAIRDLDEKAAWTAHLHGHTVPLHRLPVNGDRCAENTLSGIICGFFILIDGTCPNAAEHGEVETVVTDAMVDAAFTALPDWISREPIRDSMRAAIAAALRAQEASDE